MAVPQSKPPPEEDETPPPLTRESAHKDRPDWLVAAEEGLNAEFGGGEKGRLGHPHRPPLLFRPPQGDVGRPLGKKRDPERLQPPSLAEHEEPEPPEPREQILTHGLTFGHAADARPAQSDSSPFATQPDPIPSLEPSPNATNAEAGVPWTAAASSVPTLRLMRQEVEDSPESSLHSSRGHSGPEHAERPPHPAARPAELEDAAAESTEPFDRAAVGLRYGAPADRQEPDGEPTREPWWQALLESKQARTLLIGALAIAALSAGWLFFRPQGPNGIAIASIRKDPRRYNEQSVRIRGTIGQVFQIGGSYAFYLHQGRDTIVVFTRSRIPVERQGVVLDGSVSTGYLDGVARAAIFERTP